jgi:hypothetical protein
MKEKSNQYYQKALKKDGCIHLNVNSLIENLINNLFKNIVTYETMCDSKLPYLI